MKLNEDQEFLELEKQSLNIKEVLKDNHEKGLQMIIDLLYHYPHAPQPQNLLGIYAERQGDILLAMKHYRAGWDLSPWYRPSRWNMERVGERKSLSAYFCDQDVEDYQRNEKEKQLRRKRGC